jgi:hypothetical protein
MASVQPHGFVGRKHVALRLGQQHRFGCRHPKMGRSTDSPSLVEKVLPGALSLEIKTRQFSALTSASAKRKSMHT